VDELKSSGKPFDISKREVWEAWEKVKASKGAPGVDGCSVEEFEADLKNNLYRVWNRMSSGSYTERGRQSARRLRPRRAADTAFQVAHRPRAHPGGLGQLLLGQPGIDAQAAQQRAEARAVMIRN
jgi:hypothetical protein